MEDSAPLAQETKTEAASSTPTEAGQSAAPEQPAAATEPAPPAAAASTESVVAPPVAALETAATADKNVASNIDNKIDNTAAITSSNDSTPEIAAKTETNVAAAETSSVRTEKKERFLGFLSPYRPDVQQGNFVSREMVARLEPGMTQNQVIFLLGTPLLQDIFHQHRWDYIFRMQKGNGDVTTSNVTVYFENGLVSRYEGGGDLPTEADYLARIADKAKAAKK